MSGISKTTYYKVCPTGTSGAAGGAENDSVDAWWVGGKLQISERELVGR